MKRQYYSFGGHNYLVEAYDAVQDLKSTPKPHKFVMLRNFDITNDIVSDTDIYIIDVDVFADFIYEIAQSSSKMFKPTTKIAFPIPGSSLTAYSDSYQAFNNNLSDYSLFYNYNYETKSFDYGSDVYRLVDKDGKMKSVLCDMLRIYHPVTERSLQAIINIDCYVNGIHMHLLCRPYNNYNTYSSSEIREYNNIYSEYVEVLFPNMHSLFGSTQIDGEETPNVWFEDNMGTVISTSNDSLSKTLTIETSNGVKSYKVPQEYDPEHVDRYIKAVGGKLVQRVPLNLLAYPYRVISEIDPYTGEEHNVKLYIKQESTIESNYTDYPYNVTIFPYSSIDENTHQYLMSQSRSMMTNTFITESAFHIEAKPGFDHGIFSIITKFSYPKQDEWVANANGDTRLALKEAYKFYYKVKEDDYDYFWVQRLKNEMPDEEALLLDEVESHWDEEYQDTDLPTDDNGHRYKYKYLLADGDYESADEVTDDEKLRRIIDTNFNGIKDGLKDWEIEDDYDTKMDFIGYRIRIVSDIYGKNVIYDTTITSSLSNIDDFAFAVDDIFASWDEVPDLVICYTQFIDRISGIVLSSNVITMNKELEKYMVSKSLPTIWQLDTINENMKEIVLDKSIEAAKEELDKAFDEDKGRLAKLIESDASEETINDVNKILDEIKSKYDEYLDNIIQTPFNFIDSINVVTTTENAQDTTVNTSNMASTVLFKPVFYKTFDLQTVKLRSGVTQNIGINLSQYMTKVTTFKLKINDIDFVESSRNDAYVIFRITSNTITGSNGTYNITNQDDEYISSGSWVMY